MELNRNILPDINVAQSAKPAINKPKLPGIGHWNRFIRSDAYLAHEPVERPVTEEELAHHNSANDLWMALRCNQEVNVYDVTPFAEFHPGGAEVLMQYAGTDASEAFRCAHAYVNPGMISRLKQGVLVHSGIRRATPQFLSPTMNIRAPPLPSFKREIPKKPTWDWTHHLEKNSVTLELLCKQQITSLVPNHHALATCSCDVSTGGCSAEVHRSVLSIRLLLDNEYYSLKLRLLCGIVPLLDTLRVMHETSAFCIILQCTGAPRKHLSTLGSVIQDELIPLNAVCSLDDAPLFDCVVVKSKRLEGSPYRHLRVRWPSNLAFFRCPLLHHVYLKVVDSRGEYHWRPYTPTSLDFQHSSASEENVLELDFLIKVYPNGVVSQLLDNIQEGEPLQVSLPMGQSSQSLFFFLNSPTVTRRSDRKVHTPIYMLAGGSGVTPFLPVLRSLVDQLEVCAHLLWFNRRWEDVVLVRELNELASASNGRVRADIVVEEKEEEQAPVPSNVAVGRLNDSLCRSLLEPSEGVFEPSSLWLICGPSGFCEAANEVIRFWEILPTNVHIIRG